MITEINLANYYLRKKEIEDAFGKGNDDAGAIKNAIETKVNNVTTRNTANGTAIADIKANTTIKGTIYHPKIHNGLNGVTNENGTLNHGSNFTIPQPVINSDGHVTSLTSKTYTLPTQNLSTNDFTDEYKNTLDNLTDIITDTVSDIDMIEVVSELPTNDIKTNKLYLVPNHDGTNLENKFDFYIRVGEDWEQLDGLSFNIGNYVKKTEADNTYLKNISSSVQLSNLNPNVFDTTDGGSNSDKLITSKAVFNGIKNHTQPASSITDSMYNYINNPFSKQNSINSSINDRFAQLLSSESTVKNGHTHNQWKRINLGKVTGVILRVNKAIRMATLKISRTDVKLSEAGENYYLLPNNKFQIPSYLDGTNNIIPAEYAPLDYATITMYSYGAIVGTVEDAGYLRVQSKTSNNSAKIAGYVTWAY